MNTDTTRTFYVLQILSESPESPSHPERPGQTSQESPQVLKKSPHAMSLLKFHVTPSAVLRKASEFERPWNPMEAYGFMAELFCAAFPKPICGEKRVRLPQHFAVRS